MKLSDEQLTALRMVARSLGSLNGQVVFVGGIARGLLVTDPGAHAARGTNDEDIVIDIGSRLDYQTSLRKQLRRRGFRGDMPEGGPICLWLLWSISGDVITVKTGCIGFA